MGSPADHVPTKIKDFLRASASRYPLIQRVLVYGSRARGDDQERSDFDLAVVAPGMPQAVWSRFALDVEENIPTLCGVELVLLNENVDVVLRAKIEKEGVTLYERAA